MRRLSQDPQDAPRLTRLADALAAPMSVAAAVPAPDTAERLRREREQVLEAARQEGQAKGLAEAEADVSRRVEAIASRLEAEHQAAMERLQARASAVSKLADGLAAAVSDHASVAEEVAVEAAFAAVLRILGDKATERSLVREVCQQALAARGAGMATLRLSPADREGLDIDAIDLQVVADPSLAPGQCILESTRGASDTGLDVRLEAMKRAFLDGLSGHRQGR